MDEGIISVRYARALLKGSVQADVEDKVYREMRTLAQSFLNVPQLRPTIDNPMLPKARKQELLATACGGTPCALTESFIQLVLKEERENMIQFMASSFITLYRKRKHIISGKLTTAAAVSPDTARRVRQMVERKTNETVEFEAEVAPDLIGGFILEYDTYRMDASVKQKLATVLSQMKK